MSAARTTTLGTLLHRSRMAAGLTQEELAARSGVSARTISDLERGLARRSRPDTLSLLAEALALSTRERAALEHAARHLPGSDLTHHENVRSTPDRSHDHPLIGRDHELVLLERHLAGEGPRVVVLAGDPGIGKTRLLRELAYRGRAGGWWVLEGGCHRRSGLEPYAPVLDALGRALAQRPATWRQPDLEGCAWLVHLLPELAQTSVVPAPTWALPPEQERRLMFAATARYLDNIAGSAGTLLLLDDVHWAGQDALDLLAFLVRAAGEGHGTGLRVVLCCRSTEISPEDALGVLLADWAREGAAQRIKLGPLGTDDAGELVGGLLADLPGDQTALGTQIVERAGGIPFFLVSLTQAARDGSPVAQEVPWTVAETTRQRVAMLPREARDLLGVVAVCGRAAPTHVLLAEAARLGLSPAQALDSLELACRAGLIAQVGDTVYACAHDLIRDVVASELSAARRTSLHRWVAETLEEDHESERTVRLAELAWHYAAAGDLARAAHYAIRAGDRAELVYAHAEAEQQYRLAVEWSRSTGEEEQESLAEERLGGALLNLARIGEAKPLLERGAAYAERQGDLDRLVRLTVLLSRLEVEKGTPGEAVARLLRLLALVETQGATSHLPRIYLSLAHAYYADGQYAEELDAAERSLAAACASNDEAAEAHARERHGAALFLLGRLDEARSELSQAVQANEAVGQLRVQALAHTNLGNVLAHVGQLTQAQQHFGAARDLAERLALSDLEAMASAYSGLTALLRGDWPAARLDVGHATSLAPQFETTYWASALVYEAQAQIQLADGQVEQATSSADTALMQAVRSGDLQRLRAATRLRAECDLLVGDPAAARARLLPLLDRPGLVEADVNALLPALVRSQLALGHLEAAVTLATETVTRLRSLGDHLALADGLCAAADALLRVAGWQQAMRMLDDALELSQNMSLPYVEARAHHLYGDIYKEQGEPERARERYQRALDILRQLGERLFAGQIERAIAMLT